MARSSTMISTPMPFSKPLTHHYKAKIKSITNNQKDLFATTLYQGLNMPIILFLKGPDITKRLREGGYKKQMRNRKKATTNQNRKKANNQAKLRLPTEGRCDRFARSITSRSLIPSLDPSYLVNHAIDC